MLLPLFVREDEERFFVNNEFHEFFFVLTTNGTMGTNGTSGT